MEKHFEHFEIYLGKAKEELKNFLHALNQEKDETKEAATIFKKYLRGEKVTDEEDKKLKEQFFDIIKGVGIVIPTVLIPGSSVLIPFLIYLSKKWNINILPSAFNDNNLKIKIMEKIKIFKEQTASFDIDCQKGFTPLCPLELPVPDGHLIVDELNTQAKFAKYRIGSKDVHPFNAIWIANEENPQFSPIKGDNVDLRWNRHCMSGTAGSELLDGLPKVKDYDFFVFKGIEPDLHPYSPIYHDLGKKMSTGVIEWLKQHNINTVISSGLATNYCSGSGAIDLSDAGFRVIFNLGASRGIGTKEVINEYIEKEFKDRGIIVINSASELIL